MGDGLVTEGTGGDLTILACWHVQDVVEGDLGDGGLHLEFPDDRIRSLHGRSIGRNTGMMMMMMML